MFSLRQKQKIAQKVEELLLSFDHPEMPKEKPKFNLRVWGKEFWSSAKITPNWEFHEKSTPSINPHNEEQDIEQIKCACVKKGTNHYLGRDHAECFGKRKIRFAGETALQGFWTTHDRYVDRKEAGVIGYKAGQLEEDPEGKHVYSEDFFSEETTPLCKWDADQQKYVKR